MRYSQNNEEKIILDFFAGTTGTLLDLGANDGITFSNSRALIEKGWSGLLIEASPSAWFRLARLYYNSEKVQTLCCAVGAKNEEITLYESGEHLKKGDVALVSSVKPAEVEKWTKDQFTEKKIPCLTWEYALKLSTFKKFDFITIDIEGMELEVLPQMDFDKMETRMVCVEFNGKHEDQFGKYLKDFELVHKNGENLIFAR